jgi:hypothetical protein
MRKGFLRELVALESGTSECVLIEPFCQSMYQSVRTIFKADSLVLGVERFALAAFLKQTGSLNMAISFAKSLTSQPGNQSPANKFASDLAANCQDPRQASLFETPEECDYRHLGWLSRTH